MNIREALFHKYSWNMNIHEALFHKYFWNMNIHEALFHKYSWNMNIQFHSHNKTSTHDILQTLKFSWNITTDEQSNDERLDSIRSADKFSKT